MELLAAYLLGYVVHLVKSQDFIIGKDHAIHGSRIGDNPSSIWPNIAQVGKRYRHVPVDCDAICGFHNCIVDAARWEPGKIDLIPPADVDNSVWELDLLDVVESFLFLQDYVRSF